MKLSRIALAGVAVVMWTLHPVVADAQIEMGVEAQATATSGDHTPLWLNANKYGLSSLDTSNGYLRVVGFRPLSADSVRRWGWGAGADVSVASGFTSTLVVQQAYGELRWLKGLLTIGSKEQPMELKNQWLSTGSQTLGVNARPVPGVRLSLPSYWTVPGTRGWVGLKGHIGYGVQTDGRWQKDFTRQQTKYAEHTLLHTKAGFLRLGKEDRPLTVELGLEMGTQFGGNSFADLDKDGQLERYENEGGLKGAWHALIPGGEDSDELTMTFKNTAGNHLGSYLARVNLDYAAWGLSAYADHFFEDQSQMFFLDKDNYVTTYDNSRQGTSRYLVYDLRDMMVGLELRLKHCRWVNTVVAEHLYTKYQSGPIYHDRTDYIASHIGGSDNYYNHRMFAGWQHWGQVMGNPLYRSPLYNADGMMVVKDNRFWAWHLAASGSPLPTLRYRLMCTWQKGFGSYEAPLVSPQRNTSLLAEVTYEPGQKSRLAGWTLTGGVGADRGELLGDNLGMQITVGRKLKSQKRVKAGN